MKSKKLIKKCIICNNPTNDTKWIYDPMDPNGIELSICKRHDKPDSISICHQNSEECVKCGSKFFLEERIVEHDAFTGNKLAKICKLCLSDLDGKFFSIIN